ncbi:MAG: adenylate/guanylate cyclase domain-containing protein [Alphaproteobacteria bacterium]|nr:adenylate/guanylate cyclase domain-containing protein [Alphaproteobacteria bacterium]
MARSRASAAAAGARATWHVRIQAGLTALFFLIIVGLSATILSIAGARTSDMVREASFHYVNEASKRAVGRTVELIAPIQALLSTLAASTSFRWLESPAQAHELLPVFRAALAQLPQLYSIYVGFDDGSWLQLANLDNVPRQQLDEMRPPPRAIFRATIIVVNAGQRQTTRRVFLGPSGEVLEERDDADDRYDPRTRTWFADAHDPEAGPITDIYMSYYLKAPLYTVRAPLGTGVNGVIAADVLLTDLNSALHDARVGKTGVVFLFDDQDRLVAHPRMAELMRTAAAGGGETLAVPRLQDLGTADQLSIVDNWKKTGRSSYEATVRGRDLVVSFEEVPLHFATPTYLAVIAPEDEFFQDIQAMRLQTMVAAVAAVVLTIPFVWWLGHAVSRQVRALAQDNERIRRFEIDEHPWQGSHIREIDELGRSAVMMKTALSAFGRYVPKQLVRQLIESGERPELGGTRREITILFTDIRGFSTIADAQEPEKLMRYMSRYLAAVTDEIMRHEGTVDKFIGDAVMAFWNAPTPDDDHAAKACAAALACRKRIAELNREFAAEGWPAFRTRFGLHLGEAIVGNVGSSERMSYTAMGSSVNIAARLEQLNKEYGTEILVSEALRARVGERFAFRRVGDVVPKGLSHPIGVFELRDVR